MRNCIAGMLAGSALLAGCSSANIAANEAAFEAFIGKAEADLSMVWAAFQQNCAAVNLLLQQASVASCLAHPNGKTQANIATAIGAAQSACATATSTQSSANLTLLTSTVLSGYAAAKSVQNTTICTGS